MESIHQYFDIEENGYTQELVLMFDDASQLTISSLDDVTHLIVKENGRYRYRTNKEVEESEKRMDILKKSGIPIERLINNACGMEIFCIDILET